MKVVNILQSKGAEVYAVTDTDPVEKAVSLLTDKNIGAVVVKDAAGKVAGILSERDIVRHLKEKGPAVLSAQVKHCMSKNPHTCKPDDSVDELMNIMTNRRVRHLPVVNGGKLMGLVSIGDVVKRKIEEIEHEAQALKQYISS
ncbi:MAG: CBS domain-containing protein [Parvularculaceae bacterium]